METVPQMRFIKTGTAFCREYSSYDPAPLFRKRFEVGRFKKAELFVCGLGYGYYFLNGNPVSSDVLTAPVSDYNALLWYNRYDVTDLLCIGQNIFCAILGNGFYNESFPTPWGHDRAAWRDKPKFAAALYIDGSKVMESDPSFLCTDKSYVTFNQLRSGETFDGRLYDARWTSYEYDDGAWGAAIWDDQPPKGVLRECCCPPVVEKERYEFISVLEREGKYILDFGQNLAGYVHVDISLEEGQQLTLRHAEEIYPDGRLKLNKLDIFYPMVDFQTDRFIAGGERLCRTPQFTYHGFRYVEIEGLNRAPRRGEFTAVFVHQDVARKTTFSCSEVLLNKIYEAGIKSVYSNMHYALTDCPTREKLGWMNDAQASFAQIYLNFDAASFFEKWGEDIKASMTESGEIPAIVPSPGYGFHHGPVADGALFELPYQAYLNLGDPSMLIEFFPYMERYYAFYISEKNETNSWLGDWDGYHNPQDYLDLIKDFYRVKFCRILRLACEFAQKDGKAYQKDEEDAVLRIKKGYIAQDGRCVLDNQTVISMLLAGRIYDTEEPLIAQLCGLLEKNQFHIGCGMLGTQFLYDALTLHGAADYVYRIITASGEPGFAHWFDEGATTLWETWRDEYTCSRNHHMFSNVLAWFFNGLLGIRPDEKDPGFRSLKLTPSFIEDLSECHGSILLPTGELKVGWHRENGYVIYTVELPKGVVATYRGERLHSGVNRFKVENLKK